MVGAHEELTKGPLSSWWFDVVRRSNPNHPGGSTQGYYVLASDGTPVLSNNYPPRLAAFLDEALGKVERSKKNAPPPKKEDIQNAEPVAPPPGASIARLFTRIRPFPAGASEINQMLGRDYMWILSAEVERIAAGASEVGKKFELPASLSARLCTFHLADNVRGQVWPWRPGAVKKCRIEARVIAVEKNVRRVALTGEYSIADSNPPHWQSRGQEGTIRGELEVDAATAKILRLRALAQSTAWNDSNAPNRPPSGKYPLLTGIVEANDPLAAKVTPEVARFGARYLDPTR